MIISINYKLRIEKQIEKMDVTDLPNGCRALRSNEQPSTSVSGVGKSGSNKRSFSASSCDISCIDLSSSSSSSDICHKQLPSSPAPSNTEFYECECGSIQKLKYKYCKICRAPQPKKKEQYCAYCSMPCTVAICPHCGEENTQ